MYSTLTFYHKSSSLAWKNSNIPTLICTCSRICRCWNSGVTWNPTQILCTAMSDREISWAVGPSEGSIISNHGPRIWYPLKLLQNFVKALYGVGLAILGGNLLQIWYMLSLSSGILLGQVGNPCFLIRQQSHATHFSYSRKSLAQKNSLSPSGVSRIVEWWCLVILGLSLEDLILAESLFSDFHYLTAFNISLLADCHKPLNKGYERLHKRTDSVS
jgi:hypothetical protein